MAGAGWVPGWVPAQGWAQASQGEISARVRIWDASHSAGALCTISVASGLPLLPLAAKIPASPGAGAQGCRGTLSPQLSPRWDIGWVIPVPASPPDRDAPACLRSHLRDGALQKDFGLGATLHVMGSFCLVRGRHHAGSHTAPCPQMPDEERQGKCQLISK